MMVLAGLGIVFFGKEIIYVVMAGKTEYFDAIPVIPLLIVGLIFSGMRQVFVLPITKAKKTKLISLVMIATGVLNIGLNFLIIPRFGKEGAAFTTAISQLAAALWFLYKVKQIDGTRYEWRKVFTVFVIGLVFCSSFFFLPSVNWMVDIFIKIGLVILFLLMLYWSNFFEAIEKERISQAWAKWRNPGEMINNIKSFGK
jgi:O-antigen/teichoic acid export membrane protein